MKKGSAHEGEVILNLRGGPNFASEHPSHIMAGQETGGAGVIVRRDLFEVVTTGRFAIKASKASAKTGKDLYRASLARVHGSGTTH